MDYLDDSRWEIERYLSQQNIRIDMFTEQMINEMAYQYTRIIILTRWIKNMRRWQQSAL